NCDPLDDSWGTGYRIAKTQSPHTHMTSDQETTQISCTQNQITSTKALQKPDSRTIQRPACPSNRSSRSWIPTTKNRETRQQVQDSSQWT
ncbi:Hypothetical predicted protein, partial [Pelobates cultripes]